ncbi:MAG: RHS repeat-associated core domain-containing protein [Acidimicrobiales bacterium]
MRARWYDTQSQVFTSVDPAIASTNQPYSYANGDPVNNSDPSGLMSPSGPGTCDSTLWIPSDVQNGSAAAGAIVCTAYWATRSVSSGGAEWMWGPVDMYWRTVEQNRFNQDLQQYIDPYNQQDARTNLRILKNNVNQGFRDATQLITRNAIPGGCGGTDFRVADELTGLSWGAFARQTITGFGFHFASILYPQDPLQGSYPYLFWYLLPRSIANAYVEGAAIGSVPGLPTGPPV